MASCNSQSPLLLGLTVSLLLHGVLLFATHRSNWNGLPSADERTGMAIRLIATDRPAVAPRPTSRATANPSRGTSPSSTMPTRVPVQHNASAHAPTADLFSWLAPAEQEVRTAAMNDMRQAAWAAQSRQLRILAMRQSLSALSEQLALHLHGEHTCEQPEVGPITCDLPADVGWHDMLTNWLALAVQIQHLDLGSPALVVGTNGSLQLHRRPPQQT